VTRKALETANSRGAMIVRFWGVRGSLATPGPRTVRYGGNTSCVEVRCGPHLLILDGGTGLREFGVVLAEAGAPVDLDLLLSHTHLDHINGVPFFAPMYDPMSRVRIWGGHLSPPEGIEAALLPSLREPLMPNLNQMFRATIAYNNVQPGQAFELRPGLTVRTIELDHPGGCIGYRIDWQGASVCYLTDLEYPKHGPSNDLIGFVGGSDVLIYDASYTDGEYPAHIGWGHSTWQAGVTLANAASAGQLVLFHHDPSHDDAAMDAIAKAVVKRRPGSVTSREGMRIVIGQGPPHYSS
jgi:phosphoribosyl 1,2-cyclic phosphodiesterase